MIFKSLLNSYIGLIVGNIFGILKNLKIKDAALFESEPYYRQIPGSNIWFGLGFGDDLIY